MRSARPDDLRPRRAGAGAGGGRPPTVGPGPPVLARRGLIAVCALAPVVELVALWAAGVSGDRALAVEVTAPAPWDVFHDLRWELVLADHWWSLGLEAAGFLVVRTLIDTLIVRLAWPDPAAAPPLRARLTGTGLFVVAAQVAVLPWTGPFLRSIVDHAGELRDLLDCPTTVPEALLEPLADAVADATPPGAGVPAVVVPAFHGGLLTDAEAQRDVATLLAGGRVRADGTLVAEDRMIRLAAGPW